MRWEGPRSGFESSSGGSGAYIWALGAFQGLPSLHLGPWGPGIRRLRRQRTNSRHPIRPPSHRAQQQDTSLQDPSLRLVVLLFCSQSIQLHSCPFWCFDIGSGSSIYTITLYTSQLFNDLNQNPLIPCRCDVLNLISLIPDLTAEKAIRGAFTKVLSTRMAPSSSHASWRRQSRFNLFLFKVVWRSS